IKTTPYEILYGQPPPLHIPYVAKDSPVEMVDRTLQAREQTIGVIEVQFEKASPVMQEGICFLWNHNDGVNGKAKVSWKNVCKYKQKGGLGLKDLGCYGDKDALVEVKGGYMSYM
nr:reverse transcriptase [Tanacetum cinerariifolium]